MVRSTKEIISFFGENFDRMDANGIFLKQGAPVRSLSWDQAEEIMDTYEKWNATANQVKECPVCHGFWYDRDNKVPPLCDCVRSIIGGHRISSEKTLKMLLTELISEGGFLLR